MQLGRRGEVFPRVWAEVMEGHISLTLAPGRENQRQTEGQTDTEREQDANRLDILPT